MIDDPLLLLDEIAEITRVPVNTLRWLRHRGEGPKTFRLGRRVVARTSDVLAWVEEQASAPSGGQAA